MVLQILLLIIHSTIIFHINSFHTGKCFRMLLQQKTEYLAHYAITLHDD